MRRSTKCLPLRVALSLVTVLLAASLIAEQGFVPARPAKNPPVEYPKDTTPPQPEATAHLVASVNDQGNVESVTVTRSATPELDALASQAISNWRFVPATQNGKPVPSKAEIDVVFTNPHPAVIVNGIWRVGVAQVTAPRAIKAPDPEYTKAARKAKIAGTVVLWLVVNKQGLPEQIRVQKSLDPGLDQKAVDAVKRWKFDPARRDGEPVAVMINVEVNFRLY